MGVIVRLAIGWGGVVVAGVAAWIGPAWPNGQAAPVPPPAAPACRTVATDYVTRHTGRGFTADTISVCAFDRAALEFQCTATYNDNHNNSSVTTITTKYESIDHVLEEVRAVPPLRRSMRVDSIVRGSSGTYRSSQTHAYDGRGRLIRETGQSAAGTTTTTWSAWDEFGRPTAGHSAVPGSSHNVRIVYAGTNMTTTRSFAQGDPVTCTEFFDASGNPKGSTCSGPAGSLTGAETTIRATTQICK